jgi:hypothetical protein
VKQRTVNPEARAATIKTLVPRRERLSPEPTWVFHVVDFLEWKGFAMIKTLGILFGIAFLFGGILGFVPGVTKDEMSMANSKLR